MAKKTLKADYEAHDVALRLQRELLDYKKHSHEIYYKREQAEVGVNTCPAPNSMVSRSKSIPEVVPALPTTPAAATPAVATSAGLTKSAAVALLDDPISPVDIILTLASFTLKRQRCEVAIDQPIKQLCGGK